MATNAPGQARIVLSAEDQTAAAFAAVSRRFTALQGDIGETKAQLLGIAAAVGAVLAALQVKERIEMLDQLDKLREKTGLSVESLSALRYQAALASVPFEELAKGIQRLDRNMALAAGGNVEAGATFKSMGINVRDASGALKSQEVILGEIADKFATYEDGPAKAALAQRLFGKAGADLIPLLNQGSEGLARQAREAKELGLLFGGDLAHNAALLNENLNRLKFAAEASAIAIGSKLVPALNELITTYLEAKNQGLLGAFLKDTAKDVFGFGRLTGDASADIKSLTREKEGLLKDIEFLRSKGLPTRDREDQLTDVGDLLQFSRIKQRNAALKDLGDTGDALSRRLSHPKTEAPIPVGADGADRAEEILKKQLKARLDAIKDFAELQKVGIEFGNQLAEAAYSAGFLSVQQLFDKQREARDADYKNETEALRANIAAQQEILAKTGKEDVRVQARGAIADSLSKLRKIELQYDNDSASAKEKERVQTQRVQDAYDALGASVLDAEGKTLQAAQIRIDKQQREDELLSGQIGKTDELAKKRAALAKLDAELADVQQRYGLLVAATADAETLIGLNAAESGATERDTLAAVGVERQKALVQLREMADAAARLADEKGTPQAAAEARALGLALKKATAEADPLLVKTREVAKELGDGVSTAAEDAILHWQGFRSLLSAIEQQILQIILRSQVTKPLGDFLSTQLGGTTSGTGGFLGKLLPGLFGAGAGAGIGSGTGAEFVNGAFAGYFADGGTLQPGQWGIAGENGQPEAIYAGAVPLHVMPTQGGGNVHLTINQNFAPGTNKTTIDQAAIAMSAVVQRAARRKG